MGDAARLLQVATVTMPGPDRADLAGRIAAAAGMEAYPRSFVAAPGGLCLMARKGIDKFLLLIMSEEAISTGQAPEWSWDFSGKKLAATIDDDNVSIIICPLTHANAMALRHAFPHTAPRVMGAKTSVGLGDRLGIATPGLIRAAAGKEIVLYLAQQSIREMGRTGRTPDDVIDAASWGVFQEGYIAGFGSDADHLKTIEDIDACIAAGFTMFTIDPGAHVDNSADTDDPETLEEKYDNLDWAVLNSEPDELKDEYLSEEITLAGDIKLHPTSQDFMRAAVKYGSAVVHTALMYMHLVETLTDRPFELEMSVDETETPTTPFEHYFVANELKRLGVEYVALAPRFVGSFEKGVDYIGDTAVFEQSFAEHAAVMKTVGPYKISIHSGSDKFSIYPVIARLAEGHVHLKTAGTSWLEALRVLAVVEPGLLKDVLTFAMSHYEEDRKSYHVSADVARVPVPSAATDTATLLNIIDSHDGRQILHVTFGSIMTAKSANGQFRFRDRILTELRRHEAEYYEALARHIGRHIAPFTGK